MPEANDETVVGGPTKRRTRGRLRFLGALVIVLVAAVAVPWVWTPLDGVALAIVPELAAPLRTTEEHDARYGTHPYIVDVAGPAGSAVVLGIQHTRSAEDPQIAAIREHFRTFSPTLVLVEGRLGWHFGSVGSLLDAFGESGEAVALAHSGGVPYRTLEPEFCQEVADAVSAFGREKTLVFYTLRVFISERDRGLYQDVDSEAAALLAKRGALTGLADALPDVGALDRFWEENQVLVSDWRELPKEALWRNAGNAWTQLLAERINAFRDRAFVAAIADAVGRGERVLAVCGSSHAILFEPALRAAIAKLQ